MSETNASRIGDYLLGESLGDGAQGEVRAARWDGQGDPPPHAGRALALKIVRTAEFGAGTQGRFRKQVETLRRMDHPALLRYFDAFDYHTGEWDEASCMVMERLEGETLSQRMERNAAPLSLEETRRIFLACLDGLQHAAGLNITHRDLKPSNVFLCADGTAKLIDFEIARQSEDSQPASTAGWKGTFDYMAPDYLRVPNFHGDMASEIFSLGICLYRALCGTLPWPAFGPTAQVDYVTRWKADEPEEFDTRPGPLQVVVGALVFFKKALAPNRKQRFATFTEMRAALEKWRFQRIECPGKPAYTLVEYLGRGGFGAVYKAVREGDGQEVAVKRLFSDENAKRFAKEAAILREARHPCLVEYIDLLECEPAGQKVQLFLVMEYLPGMPQWSLKDRIQAARSGIPPGETLTLYRRYAEGLHSLHQRGIIHRDIKPGNLYAPKDRPELARIFDLGVARDVAGTQTMGQIPGTLEYMAPEFAAGGTERGTAQSDLFALAMSLHETLTGEGPFERLTTSGTEAWMNFFRRSAGPMIPSLTGPVFEAYPGLRVFFRKALHKEPTQRHADALEFLSELSTALGKPAKDLDKLRRASALAPAPRALRAGPRLAVAAAVGLVTAVAFYGAQMWKKPGPAPVSPPPPPSAPATAPEPAPVPVQPAPDPVIALRAEAAQHAARIQEKIPALRSTGELAAEVAALAAFQATEAGRAAPEQGAALRAALEKQAFALARGVADQAAELVKKGEMKTAADRVDSLRAWATVLPETWDREPLAFLARQSADYLQQGVAAQTTPPLAPIAPPTPMPAALPAEVLLPEATDPPYSASIRSSGTGEWKPVAGRAVQLPAGPFTFRLERPDHVSVQTTLDLKEGEVHKELAGIDWQPSVGLRMLRQAQALEARRANTELDLLLATVPALFEYPSHQAAWNALVARRMMGRQKARGEEALRSFAPAEKAWAEGKAGEAETAYTAAAVALAADSDAAIAGLAQVARAGAALAGSPGQPGDPSALATPALELLAAARGRVHPDQRAGVDRVSAVLENYIKFSRKRELTQIRMMEKVIPKEARSLLPLRPDPGSIQGVGP